MIDAKADNWDSKLYDNEHSFVWKYGASVIELLQSDTHPDTLRDERVLDLGCGTGHLTAEIARLSRYALGIDRSAEMIARAKAAYPESGNPNLRYSVADGADFSLELLGETEPFDSVFSNAALHWIWPPEGAALCVSRVLRMGGRFVAEMGGRGNVEKLVWAINKATRELVDPNWTDRRPWYFPDIVEYGALLQANGFELVSARLFDRPTKLELGEGGLGVWISMFWGAAFGLMAEADRQRVVARSEELLRPTLFQGGSWVADYRRLRFVAIKVA